jgi:putative ABC transport system permease protein
MGFEIRMAWREIRPAVKRFLFLVSAIALGVAALTGLKGFSQALDRSISKASRDLIAADLAVRMNTTPTPEEMAVLELPLQKGAELTRSTETLSMVLPAGASDPILCNIRAVDPEAYPFFGKVELEPPGPLAGVLSDDAAVVSRDFLTRSGTLLGGTAQIGTVHFRVAAVLKSEPDRLSVGIELGPRILITRTGLARSGLIQFGSRVTESFLYRLPPRGLSLEGIRSILRSGIKRRLRITDYRDPNPSLSRGLERTANFLSLIGLLALLVAGIGVSSTMHTYLQQKLDTIAVLKCLGGRSGQIMRIYLVQGLFVGALGSALGIGLGYLVQLAFPRLLKGLMDLPQNLEFAPGSAIQGFTIGVFTTALFLVIPLLAIRKIRPVRVLLRHMPETRYSTLTRLRRDPLPLAATLGLLAGVGLAAGWLAGSLLWGYAFLAALLGCILVLAVAAGLLLAALRRLPRPPWLPLSHGIRNLSRPGNQAASVLITIGLGAAFILTIYFIQNSLLSQIAKSAPADFPNVFLLGITESDKPALGEFLKASEGIEAQSLIPAVPSRLLRVDGKTADQLALTPQDRRYFQVEFSLTWSESLPPDTRIVEGFWWQPPYRSRMISVGENAAQRLKISVGSVLDFDAGGTAVRGKVVNLRDTEFARPGTSNQFIFSPGSLDGLSSSYIGNVRMPPSRVAAFQSKLYQRFPAVTSIDVGQVLIRIQDLLDKISAIIRFIALFAIMSGIIMLAASVVSTRYQRIREAALLKTLGATRSQIARIQAAEFLILGSAAGLIGGVLAALAAHFLLGNLLDTEFDLQCTPLIAGVAATAALSIVTGWAANRGVLNQKPLEVLRED